jgi:uncharacterized protein
VRWLPEPNEPVLIEMSAEPTVDRTSVGNVPGTPYTVKVNVNPLVTHNTAILGILGAGKSYLALELVERILSSGIRVICLDLTGQYAAELAGYYNPAAAATESSQLNTIGASGRTNYQQNNESGGSVTAFKQKLKECVRNVFVSGQSDLLRIYNPLAFEVWRQDGWLRPDRTAPMAQLTIAEITRLITEVSLEALQDLGMSETPRCCIVFEEAHSLIPEWNATATKGDETATNGTAKAILQERKYGLGCMVITQRTANVTKSILNQCNTIFALRVFDATGMEYLRNYIGEDYAGVLSGLEDRHAVLFGRASSCRDPVIIRLNDRNVFLGCFRAAASTAGEGDLSQ